MEHLNDSPVTAQYIRVWTRRDPVLSKVLEYVERGWPRNCDKPLSACSSKRNELSVYQGCVMWGSQVVIPSQGRDAVLQELHEGHPGMSKMKALARMYVWWVALPRQGCREVSAGMSALSRAALNPSSRPIATMEMAITTLGETSYGLCQSLPREDDFDCHRFSLKMDRSFSY